MIAIIQRGSFTRKMSKTGPGNKLRIPTTRRRQPVTVPSFNGTQEEAPAKPQPEAAKKIPMPPKGEWYPPETLPRDGTRIVVKRRYKPGLTYPTMETRWTLSKINKVGYWATRSARVMEEDILGWRPA